MAMNPMQRRARTSFIMGFLVALIIGALVVVALLIRIKGINEAKEALEALQKQVYVATADIESGAEVSLEDFSMGTVQTKMDASLMISADDFEFTNEDGEIDPKYDEDGNQLAKTMIMKIDVPAGTIITKDMLEEVDDQLQDSQRIQEFNMINLPSQLKNGQYIDIRYKLPTGVDYIVLSRKRVEQCTTDTIWMEMDELDIRMMNSAIVDSYLVTGSMLYVTIYKEPGMQNALTQTYPVNREVLNGVEITPNILQEAKNSLMTRWNSQDHPNQRTNKFDIYTADDDDEQKATVVESKNQESVTTQQTMRDEYVSALEGTGQVGTGYETSN